MGYGIPESDFAAGGTIGGNVSITGNLHVTGGQVHVVPITAPSAASVALISPAAAGNCDDGDHRLKVTFVTADGETGGGTASANVTVADKTVNGKIVWSSIPTSSNAAVTSRKLYRQFNSAGDYKLLTTLADNSTVTYTDNVANAALTTVMPTGNTTGHIELDGKIQGSKGTDVASANDLTLPGDGNIFDVTGVTQINGIATSGWQSGSEVTLQFDGALTVKHNTAPSAGYAKIMLSGAADYVTAAGKYLVLYYDGTNWVEKAARAGL